MNPEPYPYCIYLVRVWKENNAHAATQGWRFTLTAMPAVQRHGFATPESLCAALYAELLQAMQNQPPPAEGNG
jgi:hypothetical protein